MTPPADYVELAVTSNFSFLRGASHPEELVDRAAALGHKAIGITDRQTLAGAVRAHVAAKAAGIRLAVGCRLVPEDGPELLVYPRDRAAYGRLTRTLTLGKRRAEKGGCRLELADLGGLGGGQTILVLPPKDGIYDALFTHKFNILRNTLQSDYYLAAAPAYDGDEPRHLARLARLAARADIKMVAVNDVRLHGPERRPLLDVLTCIREKCTLGAAGLRRAAHGEHHLKSADQMVRLFGDDPEAVARSNEIAAGFRFSLDELAYEYPLEPVRAGLSADSTLARLALAGARARYPGGVPAKVRGSLAHELRIIAELNYAPYFLTVDDIVRFARGRGILCQGRGSAANSAVCYCLGITAVDPARSDLLFARFVSAARDEPPDIDVDFEHERREEVIQYIYQKYGRERAALAATVIRYRTRSALRDVGKALGLSQDTVTALSKTVWGRSSRGLEATQAREAGLDLKDPTVAQVIALSRQLIGFPRHLSQHVGGFVITRGPLSELVPIENAAMAGRTVIEWDKDDLDALGILKIDVLGLGMLSCLRRCFALLADHYKKPLDLATLPAKDAAVYEMLSRADSIGVFQVESRAQMSMLPRLRPRCFYDLVIEVAIVRPGPIQGDMVHPFLRRRSGQEPVSFPSEELKGVLGKTLGVPLFQEQAMKIAIVAAGFSPTEADALRRAMATFKHTGTIHTFRDKMVDGMVARGYQRDFAERCFKQIEGFGTYGFPESHAASFALLVYASAWFKCHYPDVFAAALLNSQPMGFYAPAQIVRDAREHGVTIRPVDVNESDWDTTLEPGLEPGLEADLEQGGGETHALRLGLRQIKGLGEAHGDAVTKARAMDGPFFDISDMAARTGLGRGVLTRLARADAFGSLGLTRREASWAIRGLELKAQPLPLFAAAGNGGPPMSGPEPDPALADLAPGEAVVEDYRTLHLSLRAHPVALLRGALAARGYKPCRALAQAAEGTRVDVAGLTLVRQRPGSAAGVIFMTIEDEQAVANLVVWPRTFARYRKEVLGARLVGVRGRVQKEGAAPYGVIHVVAERLVDLSALLDSLDQSPGAARTPIAIPSRDFH
ncbi:MAG: error-prone DNA polymerase [Alphaproteobacteria bacterium]|nr:error-prone DNA polymerase [Alphaproteobacteria bacterium]